MGPEPEKHSRRSIRMEGYDYTLPGAYFVTIISFCRDCHFGEIKDGFIQHSEIGKIVNNCWMRIPRYFNNTTLDECTLMPNHLHGIIFIKESPCKGNAFDNVDSSQSESILSNALPLRQVGSQSGSLSSIIQNFKSVSTRIVNKQFFKPGNKIWQRNYFERIIRNERELKAIRQYIRDNPLNWETDKENPGKINR